MRLTEEQKEQIKNLKENGKTPIEISNELGIPSSTVLYHYSDKERSRSISYQKEYQKRNPPKRGDKYREYQREYHRRYYWRKKNEKVSDMQFKKDN